MKSMVLFKQYLQDKTETGYYSSITQVNNILGVGQSGMERKEENE
jgi:hypothetical protein